MKSSVKLKQDYPFTPEEVWVALTDAACVSQWLMEPVGFRLQVGCRFQLRGKPNKHWRGLVDCEVLEVQPNKLLSYSWQGDEGGTVTLVTWRIEPVQSGTRVHLSHIGFEGFSELLVGKLILGPGWGKMMKKKIPVVLQSIRTSGHQSPVDR